jgi:hypothetical protein
MNLIFQRRKHEVFKKGNFKRMDLLYLRNELNINGLFLIGGNFVREISPDIGFL